MTSHRERNPKGEGERLRQEIIDAAAAIIAEHGQDGLSLRAVARKAGITAPAIYGHFDDLDAVRCAVVGSAFAEFARFLRRRARGHTDPADRLRTLCHAYVEFGARRPQQYAAMFGPDAKPRLPTRAAPSVDAMPGAESFSLLLDAVTASIDAGLSQWVSPFEVATSIWVALHGYVGLRIGLPDFPWPPGDSMLDAAVERLAGLTSIEGSGS